MQTESENVKISILISIFRSILRLQPNPFQISLNKQRGTKKGRVYQPIETANEDCRNWNARRWTEGILNI
jgi:hypothetical protein